MHETVRRTDVRTPERPAGVFDPFFPAALRAAFSGGDRHSTPHVS